VKAPWRFDLEIITGATTYRSVVGRNILATTNNHESQGKLNQQQQNPFVPIKLG
jgi:hypothetical protein